MKIWHVDMNLAALNQLKKNTMLGHLDIEFIEFGDDFLIARMPVDHRTHQPDGILHGGASVVLAETIGSTAAACCVDQSKHFCVGLDINCNHIRSIREGYVIGIAKPFHLGKSTHVWGIEMSNEKQQLIAVSRLTMAVLNR